MENKNIIITTTETVANKEIQETLGMVKGNTVQTRHIGSDIGASLKGIVGGEIKGYVKVLSSAREEALARMIKEAEEQGADAIVSVKFATSQVMGSAAEILVYGTAVTLK